MRILSSYFCVSLFFSLHVSIVWTLSIWLTYELVSDCSPLAFMNASADAVRISRIDRRTLNYSITEFIGYDHYRAWRMKYDRRHACCAQSWNLLEFCVFGTFYFIDKAWTQRRYTSMNEKLELLMISANCERSENLWRDPKFIVVKWESFSARKTVAPVRHCACEKLNICWQGSISPVSN